MRLLSQLRNNWSIIFLAMVLVAIIVVSCNTNPPNQREQYNCCSVSPPLPKDKTNQPEQNANTSEGPPGWRALVAWPEGVTALAVIASLFFIAWQALKTHHAADAAKLSAEAAEKSATAIINSERAWILVELKCHPSTMIAHGTSGNEVITSVVDVELYCTNNGSSPAWITEKSAKLVNARELPPIPQLSEEDIVSRVPEPIGPGEESVHKWTPAGEGHYSPLGSALIIYGVVKYRDIFQKDRETWFCQQLVGYQSRRSFIRVSVPPAYIKHT